MNKGLFRQEREVLSCAPTSTECVTLSHVRGGGVGPSHEFGPDDVSPLRDSEVSLNILDVLLLNTILIIIIVVVANLK